MKCFYCGRPAHTVLHGESMCDDCVDSYFKAILWGIGIIVLVAIIIYYK